MTAAELRPMSLGEILDRTFHLYRGHFSLFIGIAALPQLLLLAFNLVGGLLQQPAAQPDQGRNPGAAAAQMGIVLITSLLAFAGFWVSQALSLAATVFAVSDVHLGRPTTVRESFARVQGKIWRVLDVVFSTGLRVLLGFMLFIVPGVILFLRYAVAMPASMLEGLRASQAMKRSRALLKDSGGRVILIYILVFILSYVAHGLLQFPFSIAEAIYLRRGEQAPLLDILSNLGAFVAGTLVGPLGSIAFSLLYYDERVRKEAFDLQHMMSMLDGTPVPPVVQPSGEAGPTTPRQFT